MTRGLSLNNVLARSPHNTLGIYIFIKQSLMLGAFGMTRGLSLNNVLARSPHNPHNTLGDFPHNPHNTLGGYFLIFDICARSPLTR